jgi:hypothetical protein
MARSITTAGVALAGIVSAVLFVSVFFVPVARGEQDELRIGKYRVTANFPCRPKHDRQVIGTTEAGEEVTQVMLICSQGSDTYSLSAVAYPEQALKSLTADAWASRTIDGLRAQPHYTFQSSSRVSHGGFPAMRMYFSDTGTPPRDMRRLMVLTDAGVVTIGTGRKPGLPALPADFADSLAITPAK